MKTFEQLAEEAYAEYRMEVIARIGQQHAPLFWKHLGVANQNGWITATRHIVEQARCTEP